MRTALFYPFLLVVFWYKDICWGFVNISLSFDKFVLKIFSAPPLLRTFFRPLKNEYRKGLILFSIIMGIIVKSFILVFTFLLVLLLIFIEIILFIFFLLLPLFVIYLTYAGESVFQYI